MTELLEWFSANKDAVIAIGVFISALSTLFALYISYSASRKNNISILREKWIDDLRTDIAELLPKHFSLHFHKKEDKDEIYQISKDFSVVRQRILLRLNPKKEDHNKLSELLDQYRSRLNEDKYDQVKFIELENDIRAISGNIMRTEWQKASKGI